MEFSDEVLQGLSYLSNSSYISDDNFKKVVNSCLGLLSGEQNVERISTICPEKSDIIKQIYSSLLVFTIEVIRNNAEEEIQNILVKQNLKTDRIEYFIKVLNLSRDNIVKSLENCNSGWPSIVDADWRLDYIVKSNVQNHVEGPLYYVVLTTEKNGKLDFVKFTCNLHQLQDLSIKLKEILKREMAEVWNMWEAKPPPVCTVKTRLNLKGITFLNEVTYEALKTVRNLLHFDKEAAILSRFLYRKRRVFRHDKGMQVLVKEHFWYRFMERFMEGCKDMSYELNCRKNYTSLLFKIYQCLKRYLKLDLSRVLFTFKQSLPYKFNKGATHAFLPTRQMLKWVLLRLQAFSKLFVRLIELSKAAGAYTYNKLFLGWALHNTFFIFCVVARILATSKFLVAKTIEWYSSFYKCLPYLEETAELFPGYDFPSDLKMWLGPVDLSPLKKKTFVDDIFEFVDLVKEEENEGGEVKIVGEKFLKKFFKTEAVAIDSDVEEIEEPEEDRKGVKRPLMTEEDLGVPVVEEEVSESHNKRMKKKGGRRLKWLKNVKKTLRKYEENGGSDRHGYGSSSHLNFNDSYVTID